MAFPTFGAQALLGTKQDAVHSTVGSKISSAAFVDNALHHAIYTVDSDTTTKHLTLTRPDSSDFQVTLGKLYDYAEEEDVLALTHLQAPGVNDESAVFFNDGKLLTGTLPPLTLFSGEDQILPDGVTTGAKSSKVSLKDTRGKTLMGLGLDDSSLPLQAGQIVNVGLRTSDLVMRLFKDKTHALNSVSISRPFSSSRSGTDTQHPGSSLLRHSTNFLSRDFRLVTIPNAIRYIARHDHYTMYNDRYGNFIYAPNSFSQTDRFVETILASNVTRDPIADVANRMIVSGARRALNNNNVAQVDDVEVQKTDGIVKTQYVSDPTANTRGAARRTANQMLRLNRKAQSSIRSQGHMRAWDLQPGDVIDYHHIKTETPTRRAILEVEHNFPSATSNFLLLSYDVGLQDLLNVTDVSIESNADATGPIVDNSIVTKELSAIGLSSLRTKGIMKTREIHTRKPRVFSDDGGITLLDSGVDIHAGFLISQRGFDTGNATGRSAIGTGLSPRTEMNSVTSGSGQGPYVLNVDSTVGFPTTGAILINEATHATYTGKSSTTFTGVSVQAPSNGTISGTNLPLRLFRTRGHEIGTVKSRVKQVIL